MNEFRVLLEGGAGGVDASLASVLYGGIAFFILTILVGWLTSASEQEAQPENLHDTQDSQSHH